jgi:hypothetical protein
VEPKSWIPRSDSPQDCVESWTAIPVDGFAPRFRECWAPGSDSQIRSNSGLHAKYAVLMCAPPRGVTVAIAHSVEASRRLPTRAVSRLEEMRRPDLSIDM